MPHCVAVNCTNRTEKKCSMYKFPLNPDRRKLWASKVKRESFKPTNNSFLCEDHFTKEQFIVNMKGQSRLKQNAVPTQFSHLKVSKPRRPPRVRLQAQWETNLLLERVITDHNYAENSDGRIEEEERNMLEEPTKDIGGCIEYMEEQAASLLENHTNTFPMHLDVQIEIETSDFDVHSTVLKNRELEHLVRQQAKEITALKSSLERIQNVDQIKPCSKLSKFLCPDQIQALDRESRRGMKWSNETIKAALQLRLSCGSSGYETLLQHGYPLPAIRTLQKRTEHINFEPGILTEVFDLLKLKALSLDDLEKFCCLTMDEFSLKPSVDNDLKVDAFIGDVTLPGHEGTATKLAKVPQN
eukprot:maker-scaffold7584_size3104-snap-gene-0.1 protein:Tk09948 transcript:maker-scaffold7584_size3104-snap-gene-0.1-mRNA-1 annotation:"PREDICTED: uncharacterized protein LOC755078"